MLTPFGFWLWNMEDVGNRSCLENMLNCLNEVNANKKSPDSKSEQKVVADTAASIPTSILKPGLPQSPHINWFPRLCVIRIRLYTCMRVLWRRRREHMDFGEGHPVYIQGYDPKKERKIASKKVDSSHFLPTKKYP